MPGKSNQFRRELTLAANNILMVSNTSLERQLI